MKQPAVYIMASQRNGTLYTGVTSWLFHRVYQHRNSIGCNFSSRRVYQHRNSIGCNFSSRYECKLLVYYELFEDISMAIQREKQIKAGSRKQKLKLIESLNPEWDDLYETLNQ